jgi:hypothetical protein
MRSAGISYPHSRASPLIGSFLLGFTYCDERERESNRNINFRCSFIGYFFPGFHLLTTVNVFLCLTMIQKRKSIKTLGNLINIRGLCPLVQIRQPRVSMLFLLHISWKIITKKLTLLNPPPPHTHTHTHTRAHSDTRTHIYKVVTTLLG